MLHFYFTHKGFGWRTTSQPPQTNHKQTPSEAEIRFSMFRCFAISRAKKSCDTVMFPQCWQNPEKLTFRVTQHSNGKETVF